MARKGRDFEKFIAELERLLGRDNVKVTTPDSVKGIYSESNREIDISLFATDPMGKLTIIECRDRKGNEDVEWIEQLVTKQKDVGARQVIAVSSAGFSDGAIKLAKAFGVILKTSIEVDPKTMASWFKFNEIPQINRRVSFGHISLKLDPNFKKPLTFPPEASLVLTTKFDTNALIFIKKSDGSKVSWLDIWRSCNIDEIYYGVPFDGTKVKKNIPLKVSHGDVVYQLITSSGPVTVISALFEPELWIEVTKIPIEKARLYNEMDKNLAQSVEYGTIIDSEQYTIGFNYDTVTGNQSLSVRKKENVK